MIRQLTFLLLLIVYILPKGYSIEIDRFQRINTEQGLSQNSVNTILCDSKGFLWLGTNNGLNKYDGYTFKIYNDKPSEHAHFTNNRIVNIWEDKKHFIWFETYDGYYHYHNPLDESFQTLPKYSLNLEEKNSRITCFFQFSDDEIWLGSSNSGVYVLKFNHESNTYDQQQFLSRGQYSISNNDIRFILSDKDNNIWIGTANGLNLLKRDDFLRKEYNFQHFFSDQKFSSSAMLNDEVWFGTQNSGVVVYHSKNKSFNTFTSQNSLIEDGSITVVRATRNGNMMVGGKNLYIFKPRTNKWLKVLLPSTPINKIFEDSYGDLWVTTQRSGVHRINQESGTSKLFDLTPTNFRYLSDSERPFFFEDSRKTLWICIHGGGLAEFQRDSESFRFHRNDPFNPGSINSNTVMCMIEDHNGTLWVGTSVQGGLNKIIAKTSYFKSLKPNSQYDDFMENIVRGLYQDCNDVIWLATKGGDLKLYNTLWHEIRPTVRNPFEVKMDPPLNIYAIFQDSKGHIWLGAKGGGIAVSRKPLRKGDKSYSSIDFVVYEHNENDANSLGSNNVYTISEDHQGRIWIGTFGNGISYTLPTDYSNLSFSNVNKSNSNLSSDQVRNIFCDSKGNVWVSTSFGLNLLHKGNLLNDTALFQNFYRDINNPNSLSYNDVVHACEDSKNNLWFGTFGGGVNKLLVDGDKNYHFEMVNQRNGLINDEVFGLLEDNQGHLWLSTENGISRFNPQTKTFDNFNKSNGLGETEFSENTCLKLADGRLVFGGVHGIEIVDPNRVEMKEMRSKVILTKFLLFNRTVEVSAPGSPLKRSISYSDTIQLKYNQSSFSIEFSAMNYLDESKTQYAYILDNFDQAWNNVGRERKATYTNLKPGNYTFEVKAALWNGKWSEDITRLHIEILPPWWRTTYAYIGYLVLFLVISFFVTRIVLRIFYVRNELRVEKAVNEVKLQFFTNISHEIRTPLTLILGPIEDMLSDTSFGENYRKSLLQVQKNGNRMLHLLNQLLDFRKLQNRKMTLKVLPVNIKEFTAVIFENFIGYAQHRGVDFTFDVSMEEQTIYIDPYTMDSVIFNLLSNAFKFTPKGNSIQVKLDKSENGSEVLIRVKDGGPGLCAKDIPLIFTRYSILSSESNSGKGTGIGLHLSNEIVKLHGGEIKVDSIPGEGCEFIVVLKIGKAHLEGNPQIQFIDSPSEVPFMRTNIAELLPEMDNYSAEMPEMEKSGTKPAILVVEDNPEIIQYIISGFSSQYRILQATNGIEGLEMAEKISPELIISDIMMPELDGLEMTRRLKSNFNTCHIPVVLLTAKTSVEDQMAGLKAGALAYVVKPFNMGVLRSLVDNLFVQRKLMLSKYRDKQDIELSEVKFQSRDQEFIDNLVKHIERNYSNPQLTINSLAEFSCVSRTVFYNKVKSLTGISPVEFLRQIKLKIAAKMLEQGYNVSEAALNIGFNDTRYFSRQFRDLFGESPSQYRKKHNTGVDDSDE